MKKISLKKHLSNRLKIIGFVFSLVGWLMLVTVPLERFFHKDLSALEQMLETNPFKWGINIFVIVFLIVLIKGKKWIDQLLEKCLWLKIVLKIIFIGGAIGWVIGLGSLLL